jgi:hypothetical protein
VVWNGVVWEDSKQDIGFLNSVRSQASADPQLRSFVEELVQRKRSLFGDDLRLLGDYGFVKDGHDEILICTAMDPFHDADGRPT